MLAWLTEQAKLQDRKFVHVYDYDKKELKPEKANARLLCYVAAAVWSLVRITVGQSPLHHDGNLMTSNLDHPIRLRFYVQPCFILCFAKIHHSMGDNK